MRILRRLGFTIGVFLIALGVVTAVFGAVRTSFLAETNGLVTEALLMPGTTFRGTRLMFYQYTVDGTKYSGMTRLQLEDLQDDAGGPNRTIQVLQARAPRYQLRCLPSESHSVASFQRASRNGRYSCDRPHTD